VTLDVGTISKSRERYGRQHPTRNYPSSSEWSTQCLFNTTTYLSSTRPPSSWTQTAASVTSHGRPCRPALAAIRSASSVSMIAANQPEELCEMSYSIHSRIGIPCRRRGRTTGTCTGGRQNALNFTTSVNAVADAVRINEERAGSGKTIVFVTPSSSSPLHAPPSDARLPELVLPGRYV
jgi:hypothetical protein